MKSHRHQVLASMLLFFVLWLILLQSAVAERKDRNKMETKGFISFEFPWGIEARVEVNLTARLINLASKSGSNTPEVTEVIQMLDGIYVRTYDRKAVDELELVNYFRQQLNERNWEILFKIKEGNEIVEIRLLFDENKVYGIFVIVISEVPQEVTFLNIVGEIAPERVEYLLRNLGSFGAMDINVGGKLRAQAVSIQNTNQRKMLAVKVGYSPTIDGVLDDLCWKIAPQADGFTDVSTKSPTKDDSVVKVVYTPKAIYVGWHLYDSQPNKIVARQIKDQVRFDAVTTEDWVSFTLDPFHTHQYDDRALFMANPLGTKCVYILRRNQNNSDSKWIDEWNVAAKIVEDGWVVEMEIPWKMLDYPETTEPIQMGINFQRAQARTRTRSWWSNIGAAERYKEDGHWMHVLPPKTSGLQGLLDTLSIDEYGE